MGIIENRVKTAFENYYKDFDLFKFAIEIAHIADYSVRSQRNWGILVDSVHEVRKEREASVKEIDFDDLNF